jgi:hypothetical protein
MPLAKSVRPSAYRAAIKATAAVGHATSALRMTPSFLIVGAQRSGTTSLYKAVTAHPNVLSAVFRKGIHYFDTGYPNGPAWYRGHFPTELTARRSQRRTGRRPITGESSPYYMFHPVAGARIAADLPGVRLLALVRDPVERAYSAYAHEFARGYETETFERALELEDERLAGEVERIKADPSYVSYHHQHHGYLARGRYVEQLARLAELVGDDRICVVDSQDFFTDPRTEYARVLRFLDLPEWYPERFDQHNARSRSPMPDSLRARLQDHFAPYDEKLADWLGRTPSWRR